MQAAVVSVLLMAGACGHSGESLPSPGPTMAIAAQSGQMLSAQSMPVQTLACDYSPQYPSPAGGNYYHAGLFGCPNYSPVWLLKDCAAYYPGNYAVPYDYREQFNYPWHGPRPMALAPVIEVDTAAKPAPSAKQSFRSAQSPRAGSRSSLTAQ